MEAQVKAALATRDYKQVSRLLKQWQTSEPQSPLLRLYAAQMQEKTNRLEAAEKNYLKLLKQTPSGKLMSQARAGLQRIEQQRKQAKAAALSEAKQTEGADELAILAIASPAEQNRKEAIAGVAKVFNLDTYSARLKIPPSGFRIHRLGAWGEVTYYADQLKQVKVPTLSNKVCDIQALQTFQICYFEALTPQPTIVCKSADNQLGKISFDWSEVSQRVSGQLPIFEQVVDIGNWGKTIHKEKIQDYAQVVDLHLAGRQIVLRLCDRLYQYRKGQEQKGQEQKGTDLAKGPELNSRIQWNQLLSTLEHAIKAPERSDFKRFGKGALEFINLLPLIHPNLDIDRRAPSDWDLAFHLYSSLCYLNSRR
ncbi:MAG: tetratricopeptide repeat protein [Cyanobacteria bacterium J06597_16]